MADLRGYNNLIKRDFLNTWVKRGSCVLDVGCGQGGDLHKWKHLNVKLVGVDPNQWAIEEARRRSKGYGTFIVGDVRSAPLELYDVICYNFSLQYQPLELLTEVTKRLRHGGLLIGVVSDSTRIEYASEQGIQVTRVDENNIQVFIPNTPYYAHGPITEPILDKTVLIDEAKKLGLDLQIWEPFSMYAKFVFKYQ